MVALVQLRVTAKHNGSEVERELLEMAERVKLVPERAIRTAVDQVAEDAAAEIEHIAGGVYWDIRKTSTSSRDMAQGIVYTPKSRPHSIDAHEPGRPLTFKARDGRWVSTYHVDHPGSRPVDWLRSEVVGRRVKSIFSYHMRQAMRRGI